MSILVHVSFQHHPHSRTAPIEMTPTNGNVAVSIEQIVSKLDTASEENTRLRDAIRANNLLLDQKIKQFEPLVEENRSEQMREREREREGVGGGGGK